MATCQEVLMYTTLGELIQKNRKQADIKLSELSRISGVSKGVISKIENRETKRPEFKTILSLAKALQIPFEQIVEHFIKIEKRPDVLREILMEVIYTSNTPLASKVALQFLQTPYEESEILMERLYDIVGSLTDRNIKLSLYDVIIRYARERGMQRFFAKALLQKFLIEMHDLKRLEESFRMGEEVLHYTDFLNREEKINLYYQMAFQAHDMKKYKQCIELGKMGHSKDPTNNESKERVALAICNSYYRMENYAELEEHLRLYQELGYRFIIERVKYYRAIILKNNEQYDEAIPLLKECVKEATKNNRIHRVTILLEVLIKINDVDAVLNIFEQEEKDFAFDFISPYNFSELGKYYKLKGSFLVAHGYYDDGLEAYQQSLNFFEKINAWKDICEMEAYLQGMIFFGKINARRDTMGCFEDIYPFRNEQNREIRLLIGKLKEVCLTVNSNNKIENGKRNI